MSLPGKMLVTTVRYLIPVQNFSPILRIEQVMVLQSVLGILKPWDLPHSF